MVKFNTCKDILEYAIAREVEAQQLYLDMAEMTEDPTLRQVIFDFSKEEMRHKAKLEMELIKSGHVVFEPEDISDFDYADHLEHYAPMSQKYQDLLQTAIKKEKLSFRLYIDLAQRVEDPDLRETLLSIAEEEARHKVTLEIELDVIKKMEP